MVSVYAKASGGSGRELFAAMYPQEAAGIYILTCEKYKMC